MKTARRLTVNREPGNLISHTILCVSHQKWTDKLFQRPQQVMLRLSERHKVVYLRAWWPREWIRFRGDRDIFKVFNVNSNLSIYNLIMPLPTLKGRIKPLHFFNNWWAFSKIDKIISKLPKNDLVLWYYFPVNLTLIAKLKPSLVVYECMDNYMVLSNNEQARIDYLRKVEPLLLDRADIIFYGSKFLMDSRREYGHKSYHYPTGVDVDFFGGAMDEDLRLPSDINYIQQPILGYWGAVDERIDYRLLYYCATRHPDWSIVMLGPMVKIRKSDIDFFLELPNVHWLGPKSYISLPGYARAFDICLLPFKESEEGKFLNPTKTLEYLATGRPVVSTRIPDMETFYSDTVSIAESEEDFLQKVEHLLAADNAEKKMIRLRMAKGNSWEKMVSGMEKIVLSRLH